MLSRRGFLASAVAGVPALCTLGAEPGRPASRVGVVLYSYSIRTRQEKDLADPVRFAEFCAERGAGGVQLPLGSRDADYVKRLRACVERLGLYLEGQVRTPKDRADVERFEAEVRTARAAGADVLRTVMQGGRRYEVFRSADDFKTFQRQARASLGLAEPVAARHKVRLAVENHKDYRAGELADLMHDLGSEHLGVCVDTGNNLALLEDPMETVRLLAPWAYACHLKDMAVEEWADGFRLSEVPLGEGLLDLKRIAGTLRSARPDVRLSLEMITRDPLNVPCLTDGYWATLDGVGGRELARALAFVRKNKKPLPRVSTLSGREQLAVEDANVRTSLEYARKHLT